MKVGVASRGNHDSILLSSTQNAAQDALPNGLAGPCVLWGDQRELNCRAVLFYPGTTDSTSRNALARDRKRRTISRKISRQGPFYNYSNMFKTQPQLYHSHAHNHGVSSAINYYKAVWSDFLLNRRYRNRSSVDKPELEQARQSSTASDTNEYSS